MTLVPTLDGNIVNEDYKYSVLAPVLVTALHMLLYGLYILLFRIGILMLKRRKRERRRGYRLFQFALIPLFVLASLVAPLGLAWDILTVKTAYWTALGLEPSIETQISLHTLEICRFVIGFFMNIIADIVLIFRCFLICCWQRKSLKLALLTWCVVIDVSGATAAIWAMSLLLSSVKKSPTESAKAKVSLVKNVAIACVSLHMLMNMILTIVIAARILWVSIKKSGARKPKRFQTVVAILVESCVFYLAAWVLYFVFRFGLSVRAIDVGSVMFQVTGIAPTLLLVRTNAREEKEDRNISRTVRSKVSITSSPVDKEFVLDISRRESTVQDKL
ncbi:hypothetical protein PM082_024935 [Marasmius tenuissimus]|nr:hypothetical protein PM082_024935 [Marasmius tenuissimus]